jgi:lysyl-tRNA synthetase class 2
LATEVIDNFNELVSSGKSFKVLGRLRSFREHGNIAFCNLEDASGRIQLVFSKKEFTDDSYKIFSKLIDVGDFLELTGTAFVTKAGEKSVLVSAWRLASKTLRGLPDEWFGLRNEEERLRRRYLDILTNPEVRDMVIKKDKFWNAVRTFLKERGFIEVETPVLETMAGGADAKPFKTHHNALDLDVYLRISTGELWQKKLMVAGLEKTFEIGRQFRNEGMDAEHLQDYTQMEFYWGYADYEMGMELVEEMYKHIALQTFGTLKFKIGNFDVDLDQAWQRYDYRQTVLDMTGVDILKTTQSEIEAKLHELGVKYDDKGFNITRAIDNLWKYCRKQIAGPGFLVGVPITVSPLAKRDDTNPEIAQRFQPLIAGSELGNGYSELNDPIDQLERFEEQQRLKDAGDEEAQSKDDEFVEALEYGMPPTCGFGMSERVFSFLMNKTIRECQIFPLMKPKDANHVSQSKDKPSFAKASTSAKATADKAKISDEDVEKMNAELGDLKSRLGFNYQEAEAILKEYITDQQIYLHCLETEIVMRALAKHLGQDETEWGIIGLLHDLDWQLTRQDQANHGVKVVEILKEAGASQYLINTVISHVYGHEAIPAYLELKRSKSVEHLLAAGETVTGLIVASALVRPDKKLAEVELSSLKKKFNTKSFAANCNRDVIMECEAGGIKLDQFLEICLEAMKSRAGEFGL